MKTFKMNLPARFSATAVLMLTLTACQQLQDGVKSIDASITSLNGKVSGKPVNNASGGENVRQESAINPASATSLRGLGLICADYESNSLAAETWLNKTVTIRNARILNVSEFRSAKTLGAKVHGEYGFLIRTKDTSKCMATVNIQYYEGLEQDILKYKKGDFVNLTAVINAFDNVSNYTEFQESSDTTTMIRMTGIVLK